MNTRKYVDEDNEERAYQEVAGTIMNGFLLVPVEAYDYSDMFYEAGIVNLKRVNFIDYSTGPAIEVYEKIDPAKEGAVYFSYVIDSRENRVIIWK